MKHKALTQALSLFQALENLEGQVKTLNNLGAVCRNTGTVGTGYRVLSKGIADLQYDGNCHISMEKRLR